MMSFTLQSSNQIKTLFPHMGFVPGLTPNRAIEVSNLQNKFYTIYTPQPNQKSKVIKMSQDFLTLNNISEGLYSIKPAVTSNLKKLNIMVSKIHWQIIGDRMALIQRQFFNQAKVVWNGLVVPLYYTHTDKVDLKCFCDEGVFELTENSELHIEHEKEEIMESNQVFNHKQEPCFQVEGENLEIEGYGNSFVISQQSMKHHEIKDNIYYQILPEMQQETETVKTFKQFIENHKQKRNEIGKRSIYAKFKQGENRLGIDIAQTSHFFVESFQVAEKIKLAEQFKQDQSHVKKTNQYFIQSQSEIHLIFFPISQKTVNINAKELFFYKILNQTSIFYHDMIYKLGQYFYLTKIQKFSKQHNNLNSIKVLKIEKFKQYKKEYFKDNLLKISKKIVFLGYSAYFANTTQQQKAHHSQIINKHFKQGNQNQELSVSNLFKLSYDNQIIEITNLFKKKQNILVISMNKNGKTFLKTYLSEQKLKLFYLDFEQISNLSTKITEILSYLQLVFQQYGDRILFIDNVHCLCKAIENDMHRQQQIITSKIISRNLLEFIDLYSQQSVILTSTNLQILDQELINQPMNHITLKNPTGEIKRNILSKVESDVKKVNELTQYVEGMSFHQFFSKVSSKDKINNFYNNQVLKIGKKEQTNDFSKVAGLTQAKKIILETVQTPFKYSSLYKNLDIKLPRGILLYGPSGVGKTYLANSIQDQMKMKFFEIKGSDILNKYIGASQQAVRDIFQKAASVSPSVIFFDEFQSIVPKRNADNTGVNDRVVNQFLCYLDGVSSIEGVFIIAASSRPQMIDPALLRPGRIDKHVYLQYPNQVERKQILIMFSKSIQFEFDMDIVIKHTINYSYSDMIGLIKELRIKKANEVVKKEPIDREQFKKISLEFFQEIHSGYRIAVNVDEQKRQANRFKKFANKQPEDITNQKTILA